MTPDPRYLYVSERHREGLAHLLYGVQQAGGFVQLTGEVGCGKTTLCRSLVQQLPPETDIALILNPCLTALELLAAVCDELRVPYPERVESIKVLIDALNHHLLESHARHRRTVLIIDEAQNLSGDVLEQIRLLTNLETTREKLLQIILIGQPELLSVLGRKELRQLAQRITARYHLLPLSRRETYEYIRHRLSVAGGKAALFTPGALRKVYLRSGGVPRLINIICDRALLGAYSLDRRQVTASIVRQAGIETGGIVPWYRRPRAMWAAGSLVFAALAAGIAVPLMVSNASFLRKTEAASSGSARPDNAPVSPSDPASMPAKNKPEAAVSGPAGGAPASPPTASKLIDLLADPSLREDAGGGFETLLARWGAKLPADMVSPGCPAASKLGFECLSQQGGWPKLRRFNVPAILELVLPTGRRQSATLVSLGDEAAILILGGKEYSVPLLEIDRLWDGSFTLIWRPPLARRSLMPGSRGDDVIWLRRTLDLLENKEPGSALSNRFDEGLRRRVMDYQRSRSLIPDGFVGSETLVRMTADLGSPEIPSIAVRVP